jgi:hypothetical protein
LFFVRRHTQEYIDWILDYLASVIQFPGAKIRHIPVYISKVKRVGKGSLFKTIQKILHKDYVLLTEPRDALDKGKTFLHRKLMVLVDEIYIKGEPDKLKVLMNIFKLLATDEEHRVRTLYSDYRTIYSNTNFLFFSNETDAISFDETEGRYFYVQCLGGRMEDSFYEDYWEGLDPKNKTGNKLAHCVKHYLLNRKIKTYDDLTPEEKQKNKKVFTPDGTALLTDHFYEACKKNGTESKLLCRDLIKQKETPFNRDVVAIGEAHNYLREKYNLKERMSYMTEALDDLDAKRLGECKHKASDKHPTLCIVRNLGKYQKFSNGEIADNYWLPLDTENYEMNPTDIARVKNNLEELKKEELEEAPF